MSEKTRPRSVNNPRAAKWNHFTDDQLILAERWLAGEMGVADVSRKIGGSQPNTAYLFLAQAARELYQRAQRYDTD